MLEEVDEKEISKRFFGRKQNIATVVVVTIRSNKVVDFENILSIHRITFCRLSNDYLYTTYLLANVHPSLCEFWFGPEKFDSRNYIFGAVDTTGSPDVVFHYMVREEGQNEFRISSTSKDIEKYLLQNGSAAFNRALERISLELESRYGWNPEYRSIIESLTLREGVTLSYLYRHATADLLTAEQEAKRKETLERLVVDCTI